MQVSPLALKLFNYALKKFENKPHFEIRAKIRASSAEASLVLVVVLGSLLYHSCFDIESPISRELGFNNFEFSATMPDLEDIHLSLL